MSSMTLELTNVRKPANIPLTIINDTTNECCICYNNNIRYACKICNDGKVCFNCMINGIESNTLNKCPICSTENVILNNKYHKWYYNINNNIDENLEELISPIVNNLLNESRRSPRILSESNQERYERKKIIYRYIITLIIIIIVGIFGKIGINGCIFTCLCNTCYNPLFYYMIDIFMIIFIGIICIIPIMLCVMCCLAIFMK